MLYFDRLSQLNEHTQWLNQQLKTDNYYLVGGVVRDLLL